MKYYTTHQAAKYLSDKVHFADPDIKLNTKFIKRLREEVRLVPRKRSFIGQPLYSKKQLDTYAYELNPR